MKINTEELEETIIPVKETDLIYGIDDRPPLKETLFAALQQPLPMHQGTMPGNPGGMPGQQGMPNVVPVHTVDNSGAAAMGLGFGILSIVFAFLVPLVSILLACLGFSRARMGAGSRRSGQAKAGKILCIIGIIAAIVMWGMNILMLIPAIGSLY